MGRGVGLPFVLGHDAKLSGIETKGVTCLVYQRRLHASDAQKLTALLMLFSFHVAVAAPNPGTIVRYILSKLSFNP